MVPSRHCYIIMAARESEIYSISCALEIYFVSFLQKIYFTLKLNLGLRSSSQDYIEDYSNLYGLDWSLRGIQNFILSYFAPGQISNIPRILDISLFFYNFCNFYFVTFRHIFGKIWPNFASGQIFSIPLQIFFS